MKNEIIFILYTRLRIYITKLIGHLSLIMSFITLTSLNKPFNNYIFMTDNNNKLAFNLNVLYLYKTQYKNDYIKKIEIDGLNKILYNNVFHNYKLLRGNYIPSFSTEKINIKKNINYLKNSGFVNNIRLTLTKMKQTKYLILYVYTNPILKKLTIIDSKYLQIPTSLLIGLFKTQIGLPQNYIDLNQSIKEIYWWYKNKGFTWVNITITRNKKSECLLLKIIEGKILKIRFVCTSTSSTLRNINHKIEERIKWELNIAPGNIFNIKRIESGINHLKDIKLVNECTYKAIPCNDGLAIIIKYTIFENQIKCLYKKSTILNKIFNIDDNNKLKKHSINYYPLLKNLTYQILQTALYYKLVFINTSNRIILLNKYLSFQYISSFSHLNNEKKFILDIHICQKFPFISMVALYPSIKINQNVYGNLIIKLYYQLNKIYNIYTAQAIHIASIQHLHHNKSYSSLKFKGVKILFRHYLYNDIYLTEKMDQINYTIAKNSIYLNRLCSGYKLQSLGKKNVYKLKILHKTIRQKIIDLSLKLKYDRFSSTHKIKFGKSLLLDLISCISLPFNKLKTIYSNIYSFEYIYIQYHQISIISNLIKFIKVNHNALILFLEMNWHINNNCNPTLIQLITKQSKHLTYNFSVPPRYFYLPYPSYLYHIEFSTSVNTYISLYFFSNYTYNLHKKMYIQNSSSLSPYQSDSNIGYGIQFNIPINKIPPIRIEHGVNNKQEKFFQLRAYSKYTKYNL